MNYVNVNGKLIGCSSWQKKPTEERRDHVLECFFLRFRQIKSLHLLCVSESTHPLRLVYVQAQRPITVTNCHSQSLFSHFQLQHYLLIVSKKKNITDQHSGKKD